LQSFFALCEEEINQEDTAKDPEVLEDMIQLCMLEQDIDEDSLALVKKMREEYQNNAMMTAYESREQIFNNYENCAIVYAKNREPEMLHEAMYPLIYDIDEEDADTRIEEWH